MKSVLLLLTGVFFVHLAGAQEYCDRSFTENNFDDIQKIRMVYDTYETVVSGNVIERDLVGDLYYSAENESEVQPLMILLHGGAFITEQGDMDEMTELAEFYVHHGFVVFNMDYRTWSFFAGGYPDEADIIDVAVKAIQNLQSAILFLVEENDGSTFPVVDVQQIVLGGASAGAITVLHHLYLNEESVIPEFLATALEGNQFEFPEPSSDYSVAYGLNLSGGIFDTAWIQSGQTPLVSVHGTADGTVPYDHGLSNGVIELYGSKYIDEKLRLEGNESYLYSFAGGGHTDIYSELVYRETLMNVLDTSLMLFQDKMCLRTSTEALLPPLEIQLVNTLARQELILDSGEKTGMRYEIIDLQGRTVQTGFLRPGRQHINLTAAAPGYYVFRVPGKKSAYVQPFIRQ